MEPYYQISTEVWLRVHIRRIKRKHLGPLTDLPCDLEMGFSLLRDGSNHVGV
jgi:hypothetical protein